jgi:hypothetical protein
MLGKTPGHMAHILFDVEAVSGCQVDAGGHSDGSVTGVDGAQISPA